MITNDESRLREALTFTESAIPERIVIAESRRLIEEVERRGMHVGGVIANYVAPANDCACDRSMRGYESEALASLGRDDIIVVERRDEPVTRLADLAALIPMF